MISQMEKEAREAPHVLRKQFVENNAVLKKLAQHIHRVKPMLAMTIARGSSDHAATFAKYTLETLAGLITVSAAPSVYTLYEKKLPVKNCLVIGISQSGASPDIVRMFENAREEGAITVAFVNHVDSPLAKAAEYVVPLFAGEEKAVAATKTYLATLGVLLHTVAILTGDLSLLSALEKLPDTLAEATNQDWSSAIQCYQHSANTLVVGRGYSFPIAQEAALKFKETSKIHAEAFSSAEILHGPFALVESNFPILLFAQQDAAFAGMVEVATRMRDLGAKVLFASPMHDKSYNIEALPLPKGLHPVCDPLIIIQAFYMMMARLSLARGLSPDVSPNLTKVTKTW